jgi:plasmid stability protein
MATLTIRNVDPEVQRRLRIKAAQNGRSMEAELRCILKDAVGAGRAVHEENLADIVRRIFAPLGGVELEPHPPAPIGPPPEFGK